MSAPNGATQGQVGVLRGLDTQTTSAFYWYLALLACIGGFLFGYDTAVIGSVLDFIPYQLSDLATGYLVAGASLGAAVGALGAGPLTDRFGRKSLLIADATLYAIGAILSAVAVDATTLIISRTLIGLAVGADSAIATAYIAEFAPADKRGQLSIIQQWMITVGILASYLIALLGRTSDRRGAATGQDAGVTAMVAPQGPLCRGPKGAGAARSRGHRGAGAGHRG